MFMTMGSTLSGWRAVVLTGRRRRRYYSRLHHSHSVNISPTCAESQKMKKAQIRELPDEVGKHSRFSGKCSMHRF